MTVLNQPPPMVDNNLFSGDVALAAATEACGLAETENLEALGARFGSAEVREWGRLANEHGPALNTHDRFGNRLDTVEFHPAWHELMSISVGAGLHTSPWTGRKNGHVERTAGFFLSAQAEAGHGCPVSMTYAVVPALRTSPETSAVWEPRVLSTQYDPSFQPAESKSGALFGMGMTERQGGSDVRANTTTATKVEDGYIVDGHKWFTSAPMNDAFLVLAQADEGLTCLLVPRWTPDGSVNGIRLQRLKDKLGNRSNASAEIEFDDAWSVRVGEEGRGIPTIVEMVNHTRLDCVIGSAGLMRQAVAQAVHHTRHRRAFGSTLIDKPLMQSVLTDLIGESEAAIWLMMRLAAAYDEPDARGLRRIGTPIAKYWVCKRAPVVVGEALECLGGNGYVEESGLPRLYRETPLNSIWEGSGNVICLDVLRAAAREPEAVDELFDDMDRGRGHHPEIDRAIDESRSVLREADESRAREVVERLAVAWQASILARLAPEVVTESYIQTMLGQPRRTVGAGRPHHPQQMLERAPG